jgi:hypothetical protein
VEENVPPQFVRASHTPGAEVILDDRGAVVYMVVSDPDNAPEISFTWDLTGEGVLPGAQDTLDGTTRKFSQIRLQPEPRYAGSLLTVTANDNSGSPVAVTWTIGVADGVLE